MRYLLGLLFIASLLVSGCTPVGKKSIPVYVYHQFPPFIDDRQTDLSHAFIKHLNRTTHYKWNIVISTRAQINALRLQGPVGVILWTNPKWFGMDPDLLVSRPVLWDADVLTYNVKRPLRGTFPAAISNKTFCALKGHRYLALEPHFASRHIKLIERDSQDECMAMLRAGKVDFVHAEKSNLFTAHNQLLGSELDFLEPPVDNFQRFVLVDKSLEYLIEPLNQSIAALAADPEWQQELAHYGESRFVDLFDLSVDDLLRYEINTSP